MSIVTKRGDQGTTALMYNRRVSKCHPRVEAYGAVDELNAAIGLARATAEADYVRKSLTAIQEDLVVLMGELATAVDDLPRYAKDGHALVTPAMTARLEGLVGEIEAAKVSPGVGPHRERTRFRRRSMSRAPFAAVRKGAPARCKTPASFRTQKSWFI